MAKLAFLTFGILKENGDHPQMQGFAERGPGNFETAESCAGYIDSDRQDYITGKNTWGEDSFPAFVPKAAYPRVRRTFSLWEDLESVYAFAYSGLHAESLMKRKDWFDENDFPTYLAWWVEDDHIPNWKEANERHEHFHRVGSSPVAFDFKAPYTEEGLPFKIDRQRIESKILINARTK